jgi:hypothetical protein
MRQVQPETLPKNSNFSSCLENILSSVILPVVKVVWGLFTSHGTFNDILMLVNVFLSLKIILPKTLQLKTGDFLQQTITMNENVQWQMIKDSVLFALSSGFFVSFLFEKKNRPEVYCSVFLLFSRCIDHFICYSRIVYIGDSLGYVTNHTLVADYLNK